MNLQFSKACLSCDSESPESDAVSPEEVSEVTPESFWDSILSKFFIKNVQPLQKTEFLKSIKKCFKNMFGSDNLALTPVHFHITFLQCQASKEPIGNQFHQHAVEGRELQILLLEQFQSRLERR